MGRSSLFLPSVHFFKGTDHYNLLPNVKQHLVFKELFYSLLFLSRERNEEEILLVQMREVMVSNLS
jgi:hypothetical protein